jgi:hypothetical protein
MDIPTCIGCGKSYKTQKQLSKHASQCQQNRAFTLESVLAKREKKRKSQARDKLRNAKKSRSHTPIVEQELDYVDLDQNTLFDDPQIAGPSGQPHDVSLRLIICMYT